MTTTTAVIGETILPTTHGTITSSETFGKHSPPLVPRVIISIVDDNQKDGILVHWDREMKMTCDAVAQISVIVDGGAPVQPTSIEFHPTDKTIMGLIMAAPFTVGQVITWAYDDTGGCDIQQIAVPNTEADNQTYGVNNNITITAFSNGFDTGFS